MPTPVLLRIPSLVGKWPAWILWTYVAVALAMAVFLTIRFLRNLRRRRPQDRGAIGVVLGVLFFPLMALSIIWPITLPVIATVLWRERRERPRHPPRAFEVVQRRPANGAPGARD